MAQCNTTVVSWQLHLHHNKNIRRKQALGREVVTCLVSPDSCLWQPGSRAHLRSTAFESALDVSGGQAASRRGLFQNISADLFRSGVDSMCYAHDVAGAVSELLQYMRCAPMQEP